MEPGGIERLPAPGGLGRLGHARDRRRDRRFEDHLDRDGEDADRRSPTAERPSSSEPLPRPPSDRARRDDEDDGLAHVDVVV